MSLQKGFKERVSHHVLSHPSENSSASSPDDNTLSTFTCGANTVVDDLSNTGPSSHSTHACVEPEISALCGVHGHHVGTSNNHHDSSSLPLVPGQATSTGDEWTVAKIASDTVATTITEAAAAGARSMDLCADRGLLGPELSLVGQVRTAVEHVVHKGGATMTKVLWMDPFPGPPLRWLHHLSHISECFCEF